LQHSDVQKLICERIRRDKLARGTRLPSTRRLASDLGVSPNVVHKAYRELQRTGVLATRPGDGVFVVDESPAVCETSSFYEALAQYVRLAQLSGKKREDIESEVLLAVRDIYASQIHRIAFIECNEHDASSIRDEMMAVLPVHVTALVLEDIEMIQGALDCYDLVCTTYYHIHEVEHTWPQHASKIVALHHCPSRESVLNVARVQRGSRIAVIATNSRTLSAIRALVMTYHESSVAEATTDDESTLRSILSGCDTVVCDARSLGAIRRLNSDIRVTPVSFRIEEHSLSDLQDALLGLHQHM